MADLNGGSVGSTPLGSEEREGLLARWVATRAELDDAEQRNIIQALSMRRWQQPAVETVLDDLGLRRLHADILGEVWDWAGSYRRTGKNIGVDPELIPVMVRDLVEDAMLWVAGDRPMNLDEAAYRFHHRLVQVHPFPNGNGRHARVATDLLLKALGRPRFTWGRGDLVNDGETRARYVAALRVADGGDYQPLAEFVRS